MTNTLPWFGVGVALSAVVGLAASGRVGRALGIGRSVAWLLVMSLGLILSATLTPLYRASEHASAGAAVCDFARIGLAPVSQLLTVNEASLNVLLFVPLGAGIGLIPRSRTKLAIVALAIGVPFAIETIQLIVPFLNRACQSADIADNLTGLALGLAVGALAGRAAAALASGDGS